MACHATQNRRYTTNERLLCCCATSMPVLWAALCPQLALLNRSMTSLKVIQSSWQMTLDYVSSKLILLQLYSGASCRQPQTKHTIRFKWKKRTGVRSERGLKVLHGLYSYIGKTNIQTKATTAIDEPNFSPYAKLNLTNRGKMNPTWETLAPTWKPRQPWKTNHSSSDISRRLSFVVFLFCLTRTAGERAQG